jgi:teichuronic acid biosynthesis glycosyltransferase TuaC
MKVLTITNMWPSEDRPFYGIFVARQMNSLPAVGVELEVVPIYGSGSPARSLLAYLRAAMTMLAVNFRRDPPDLIHAHTGHCGLLACLQFRAPVVLSYVGYDLDITADRPDNWRSRAERRFFQQLSRLMAATIAKSARGRAHLPAATQPFNTVIPNGVDRDLFAPMDRAEARARLGHAGDERPWALFPSDPDRYNKRFELAEAATEAARERIPDLQLKVAYPVPPDEMPLWMNAADLMLMSSRAEGSPNIVKEGLACGLPVVGVVVGDVPELLDGLSHCHVCDATPEAMADAVIEVVAALPERSDSRERTEHLGLEAIARRVRSVYDSARRRGPGPLGFIRRRA